MSVPGPSTHSISSVTRTNLLSHLAARISYIIAWLSTFSKTTASDGEHVTPGRTPRISNSLDKPAHEVRLDIRTERTRKFYFAESCRWLPRITERSNARPRQMSCCHPRMVGHERADKTTSIRYSRFGKYDDNGTWFIPGNSGWEQHRSDPSCNQLGLRG